MTDPRRIDSLRRILPAGLTAAALIILLAASASATVYKYVDRAGVSHYTDSVTSIPAEYRNQVKDITDDLAKMDGFRVIEGADGGQPAASNPDADEEAGMDLPEFDLGEFDLGGEDAAAGLIESFGFGIVLLILLLIPVLFMLSGMVLKLACRMAGEDPPGLGRACGILLAQSLVGAAVGGVVGAVAGVMGIDESAGLAGAAVAGGASLIVQWLASGGVLASMMSYGFGKSLWVCVLHTLLVVVMVGVPVAGIGLVAAALG